MAFTRIRNTNGFTTATTVGFTGSHTEIRPKPGRLQVSVGLPHASTLRPRVDDFQNAGLRVDKAREYVDRCEVKVTHHPGPLDVRTRGRSRQFFTSVANAVGKTVGIGRGPAPHVPAEWGRADQPAPVKLRMGKSRLHDAVFGVSQRDAAWRREFAASVSEKKTVLMSESKLDLRKAMDREAALSNKTAQIGGVQQMMGDAIQNAEVAHRELALRSRRIQLVYDRYSAFVKRDATRVSVLENARAVMETQANDLNNAILVNRSTCDVLTEQAAVLDARLNELPAPPVKRPAVFGPSMAELVTLRERTATTLGQVEQRLPRLEKALVGAQANLDAKSQEVVAAPQDSGQRARLLDEARVCLDARDQARVQLRRGQRLFLELPGLAQLCEEKIKRLDEHSQHRQYDQLSLERTLIGDKLNDLTAQRQDLMARIRPLGADLRANQLQLTDARRSYELDHARQVKVQEQVEIAHRDCQLSRQQLEGLRVENERLQPIADALSVPRTDAVIEASVLQAQEEIRLEHKLQELVIAPPGFEPHQLTPQLRAQMGQLAQRLQDVPEGLTDEQATTLRRQRIPTDQALEIISRSLSLATEGKGADAQVALTWLMDRSFADLVPLPGTNFNGERESKGDGLNDNSAEKRTASLLAACPSGGELLKRMVQPGAEPPRELQDAVAVYFRATSALPDIADVSSQDRLEFAEHAAKVLAHPQGQPKLTGELRVSFNAVRNGFTSFAEGSPYETANAAIEKFSDWVARGQTGANKTSPLHARQRLLATKVAADVGVPSLETTLNAKLKDACDELQKVIARELEGARSRESLALEPDQAGGLAGSPSAERDILLVAQSMVHYIQQCADRGERIDTMRLNSKAWRAIDKETLRLQHNDLKATSSADERMSPALLRRRAAESRQPVAEASGAQPSFAALELDLLVCMPREKPTVLKALKDVRDRLTRPGTESSVLPGAAPTAGASDARPSVVQAEPAPAAVQADPPPDWVPTEDEVNAHFRDVEADLLAPIKLEGVLDQHDQQQERALHDVQLDRSLHDLQLDQALDDVQLDQALQDLQLDRDLRDRQLDQDLQQEPELQSLQQAQEPAQVVVAPVPVVAPASPESGAAPEDPLPRTRLDQSLSDAEVLQDQIERFKSSRGDFSAAALEQWVTPALMTPSGGPAFGSVALSHGRVRGIGTSGLVGVASRVASGLGLVVRPELDGVRLRADQFQFGRDALGVELALARSRGRSFSVGLSAGLAHPIAGQNELVAAGPGGSLIHTWTTTNTTGGAVIRAPKFDGKTDAELSTDFSEMLSTALTWREPLNEDGGQLYKSPLEALLDRHPTISVTTVESARTFRHTADASLGGVLGLGAPVGRAGGFAAAALGVTSTNVQEQSNFKTTAGAQALQVKSRTASHKVGVTAGVFGRLGYVKPDEPRLAGVRANLISLSATANLRESSAASSTALARQPDGSIAGERFVEYTSYEKFEAAVNLHREKWIEAGIARGSWPADFPLADRRIVAERALDDFMLKSKASLEAGTVTLNENMDVKPEVAVQLSANIALEELARLGKRYDDALALQAVRQEILAQDSSYQPYLLKAIARSSISGSTGVTLGVIATQTHGASATQVFDWFPRLSS